MAVDEALMEAVASGEASGTLRFYTWHPPCISVGYAQSLTDEIDLQQCQDDGVEWVRRPTGGRAILHADEVTYSVVLSRDDPRVQGGVVESYRRLSQGLLAGFRILGLEAVQAQIEDPPTPSGSPACFDRPSHYEITWQGRKLVGSAQTRRREVVLQHGSIPLRGDVARLVHYLRVPEAERQSLRTNLRQRAITLSEALGRDPQVDEVMEALASGFSQALHIGLEPGGLTDRERERAAQLRRTRYQAKEWNEGKSIRPRPAASDSRSRLQHDNLAEHAARR